MILRIIPRCGLQPRSGQLRPKPFHERLRAENLPQPHGVLVDRPPDRLQRVRRRHVHPARNEAVAGRDLDVVPRAVHLAPAVGDERAEVRLVRRLVLREPRVAVDPEQAVLGHLLDDRRIERCNLRDHEVRELDELRLRGLILLPMLVEPAPAVVRLETAQELQRGRCDHGSLPSAARYHRGANSQRNDAEDAKMDGGNGRRAPQLPLLCALCAFASLR